MENKKSFLLHYDSLEILEILDDTQCGKLLRKMKSYHNGNNYVCDDQGVNIAFVSFKNQFDRDMGKYEKVCARNKINGQKGGRPTITQDNPKNPVGLSGNPKKPKKPDSDSDSDSDSDKDIKDIIPTKKSIFFEEELEKVSDPQLSNSLREWWEYKKGKYSAVGWKKQIGIVLKYPAQLVCDRIDEAIASGWQGMNLNTMRKDGKPIETPQPVRRVERTYTYET